MPRLNKNDVLDPDDVPSILETTLAISARGRGDHLAILRRVARIERQLEEFRQKQEQMISQLDRLECFLMERAF